MQTRLPETLMATLDGATADAVLRNCVHCGFCLATCPTYQLLGDELDSPRGRIYLIKSALETGRGGADTLRHLDRCLGCRSCETTCPSGVQYHRLLEIGRNAVQAGTARPWRMRLLRAVLRHGLVSPLFGPVLRLGRLVRPLLPQSLRERVPVAQRPHQAVSWQPSAPASGRGVILPRGCVQPHLRPGIDIATMQVLAALGDRVLRPAAGDCCGAIPAHLDDAGAARMQARANIDAWWPLLESGAAEVIVSNASACGLTLRDYPDWFEADPLYGPRARRIAAATVDLAQWLAVRRDAWPQQWTAAPRQPMAWHPPCTLTHGLAAAAGVEATLFELGIDLQRPADAHLCCGSAGAWSVLHPELADRLRQAKLGQLDALPGGLILTANIGCQQHLAARSARPVLHWVEWLAERD